MILALLEKIQRLFQLVGEPRRIVLTLAVNDVVGLDAVAVPAPSGDRFPPRCRDEQARAVLHFVKLGLGTQAVSALSEDDAPALVLDHTGHSFCTPGGRTVDQDRDRSRPCFLLARSLQRFEQPSRSVLQEQQRSAGKQAGGPGRATGLRVSHIAQVHEEVFDAPRTDVIQFLGQLVGGGASHVVDFQQCDPALDSQIVGSVLLHHALELDSLATETVRRV